VEACAFGADIMLFVQMQWVSIGVWWFLVLLGVGLGDHQATVTELGAADADWMLLLRKLRACCSH
jgi:hypothetical protein